MPTGVYDPRWLPCRTPQGTVRALAFTLDRASPAHTGALSDEQLLDILRHAARWVAARFADEQARRAQMGFDDLLTRLDAALQGPNGPRLAERIRTVLAFIDSLPQAAFAEAATRQITIQPGTPREIVMFLNAKLNELVKNPEFQAKLVGFGIVPRGGSPGRGGRRLNSGGTDSGGRDTTVNSSGASRFKPSVSCTEPLSHAVSDRASSRTVDLKNWFMPRRLHAFTTISRPRWMFYDRKQ